jgi:class 3 adenylate cyclase
LISEDTYEEVKERLKDVEFISFEPQEVKGKKKLVTVYEVKRLTQGRDES